MTFLDIILEVAQAVVRYLRYDWWILSLGIATAVVLKVYAEDRISRLARSKPKFSVPGAVGVGAFTPLCACGTMAVILSMFASSLPWGTVMAFLLTSPLTSPTQIIYQSSFLGTRLAVAGLVSALGLGLTAGLLASYLERHTSFFKGQYRLAPGCTSCEETESRDQKPCCASGSAALESACSKEQRPDQNWFRRWKLDQVILQTYELGVKRVLLYFALFIALGRLVEMFIPPDPILTMFSPDKFYSVPLAALIGLPLYVSGSSGLPLLESFLRIGAGEGAVLAFLIAGQGTSVGVMLGISTFIKKKAIAFYVTAVLFGAILSGYIYQLLASLS